MKNRIEKLSSPTHKKKLEDIQSEMIDKVREKCSTLKKTITFRNSLVVYVTENDTYINEDVRVQYVVYKLQPDCVVIGTSFGDDVEINLAELDIYEIAHILDELDNGHYTIDEDDEFIDPAGGRGLHSHI